MKHYKKPDGSVWAYELDGSQDDLITADMVALTDAEVQDLLNPPVIPPTLLEQIEQIEAANPITHRTLRDMILAGVLTGGNPVVAKVAAVDAQIAALRASM